MQFKTIAACLVLLFMFHKSVAQNQLTGIIENGTTKQPLENATIRIPEVALNTISDKQGEFIVSHIPTGKFTIQFSYIGFQSVVQIIDTHDSVNHIIVNLFPTTIEQKEIVITGYTPSSSEASMYSMETMDREEMAKSGSMSVNEALANIPGVSLLSTGVGIGKPVIRGLYGNRIQTVMQNIRFENQQWQDEHNSGLSEIGIDRIEIIKGPASLLYGSEAIGGVIHVIDEEPAPAGTMKGEFSTRLFSNTLGIQTELGVKKSGSGMNWKIIAGGQSHADYTDGDGTRILNTRFNSIHVKAGIGWNRKNFKNTNTYQFSHEGSGFILIDSLDHPKADARTSRNLSLPHHLVNFHLLTSENTWFRNKSKIQLNAGIHLNHRQEQEGGNKISIDMLCNSYNLEAKWSTDLGKNTRLTGGGSGSFQSNNNYGKRIIIPDASLLEGAVFVFLKQEFRKILLQGGVRYDLRHIATYATDILNTDANPNPFDEVVPFQKSFGAVNGAFGANVTVIKNLLFKVNVSSGYRTPNLAELSSNGLHEGTLRYEVGDANLKIEQSLGLDGTLQYSTKRFLVEFTAFQNTFENYIYLENTGEEYIGFSVNRYVQTNARLYGGEFNLEINPGFISWLTFNSSASLTVTKKSDGEFLPFIPPLKISNELRIEREHLGFIKRGYVGAEWVHVYAQNATGPFETASLPYNIVNVRTGGSIKVNSNEWTINISVNNLLNEAYCDHLSRLKPLGLNNIGRNFILNLTVPFYLKKKN